MKQRVPLMRLSIPIVFLTGLMVTSSMSQVTLKLGGGLGILSPASDFGGSTLEYYNGSRYGFGSGLNLHAKAKVGLAGWDLTGALEYSSLSNSGNAEPGQGSVNISQKVLSLRIGPEFRLSVPALPVTPYLGAHVALNSFSGETTFQGVSKVPSATYSVAATSRIGVGFSVGTEVSVGPLLSLDFNLSYNLMNLSGKEWDDVNPGIDQRIDSYLSLNDDRDPRYTAGEDKHFIDHDRNIHSILFTASILFGL